MGSGAQIEFWVEYASTYSYLSVMRIETLAKAAGVQVRWRPFLLGPIFAAQGWTTSPFNLYPAKGRYMVRDLERLAQARGLPFRMPEPFPQNTLLAARVGTVGVREGWVAEFSQRLFTAEFAQGKQISDPAVIGEVLASMGLDGKAVLAAATSDTTKAQLRSTSDAAVELGIFGAPTFVVGRELFWGDDRLEQALEWAQRAGGG